MVTSTIFATVFIVISLIVKLEVTGLWWVIPIIISTILYSYALYREHIITNYISALEDALEQIYDILK